MNGDSHKVIKTVDDNENKLGRNLLLRFVFSSFFVEEEFLFIFDSIVLLISFA